jgi:Radial spoke protein 3
MEGARRRRTDETERRNLQSRTLKTQRTLADKKVVCRVVAKEFLMLFKRNTLKILTDQGLLRRPSSFSLDTHFIPELYG